MLLIPYKRFALNIYRPLPEVEAQLAARVTERRIMRRRSIFSKTDPSMPFEGVVENGRFNINRLISYKNSFLPYVVGELQDELDVTRVKITMRLNYFVLGFMIVWLFMFGGAFLIDSAQSTGDFMPVLVFPVMMILVYVVLMGFFNWEVNKAVQFLEETWGEKLNF